MDEHPYIGAYWYDREESVERCAQRVHDFLTQLQEIDPVFQQWYQRGRSRKDALKNKLRLDPTHLKTLLLARRQWTEVKPRTLIPELGFSMGAWNGGIEGSSVGLNISCGCYGTYTSNVCVIDLPSIGPAAERLLKADVLKKVLEVIVNNFEPEWTIATSHRYREKLQAEFGITKPFVSWITYLSLKYRPLPVFPAPIRTFPTPNGGAIIVLTPARFSLDSDDHMGIARKAQKLFAPLCSGTKKSA